MEIRVSVTELSKALTLLQSVVQRKNTLPILSNILLQANVRNGAGELVLTTTDLEVGLRMVRPCEVLRPGEITVSAKALFDIVKMLPGPEVAISMSPQQHVNLKSGRTVARLVALPAEDFPQLPSTEGIRFQELEAASFIDMLQKTIFCASADDTRHNLTGVFFEPQRQAPNRLMLIATDGHRLSRIERVFENANFETWDDITLPRKGLTEVLRVLDTQENLKTFELGFSSTQAIFRCGNTLLTMRLIDSRFPDYNQVIPKVSDKILCSSRVDLLTSLRRVSVLANDKSQSLKLSIQRGGLTVSCANPEAGEVSDDVSVDYTGPDMEIAFNARYVVEAISALQEPNLILKLTDGFSPVIVCGTTGEEHICVVMPMRA